MILELIEKETGVSADEISRFLLTTDHRYKTYKIQKRTSGHRIIHHPTPDLKFLQRWLNRKIFRDLPIHKNAFAYKRGINISHCARLHANDKYLLKIDFSDFFPSLTNNDVRKILEQNSNIHIPKLTKGDIKMILRIVCRFGELTIGAPSSPVLSNAILYDFDCAVTDASQEINVKYSRYADDLFFSTNTPNKLADVLEIVRNDLKNRTSPRLIINEKKTVFSSRKGRRIALGLVLTTDGRLSIGRSKKRSIRTLIYLFSTGMLSPEEISYLRGYLAFVSSVEPEFVENVRKKYGNETINKLLLSEPIILKSYV